MPGSFRAFYHSAKKVWSKDRTFLIDHTTFDVWYPFLQVRTQIHTCGGDQSIDFVNKLAEN